MLSQALTLAVLLAQAVGAPSPSPSSSPTPPQPGTIPATLAVTVTGHPATSDFLQRTIRAALDRAIRPTLQPSAAVTYGPIAPLPQALAAGYLTSVDVPVTIVPGDPSAAPLTGITTIDLTNADLPAIAPTQLVFDDDPEYVETTGLLTQATVDAAHPTRLYYYHADTGLPKDIAVVLTTPGPDPSRVQLIAADGGPDLDVMSVGDDITRAFLEQETSDEGILVDVQPGKPFVLRTSLALTGELVAGAIDARVVMGGPVTANVVSYPPGTDVASALAAPPVPHDGKSRHGTFDLATAGSTIVAYTAGGPNASTAIGGAAGAPKLVPGSDGNDTGAYGVLQHIAFELANPTLQQQTIYLYEEAHGGPVRATYLVDGALVALGCARVPQPYLISQLTLDPSSQRTVSVLTMADGGSNFPLEIGATATPPQPTTPPQNAPDGCFPKPQAPLMSPLPTPTVMPSGAPQGV